MLAPVHAGGDTVARVFPQAISAPYSSFESTGVIIVVVTACMSLLCVSSLFGMLIFSMWKNRISSDHFFVRTHAASYFTCLLLSDIIQVIGSLMSSRWVRDGGVVLDSFCLTQGAIKNAGNLGISLWSLALAIHAFCILFLRWKPRDWVLYSVLFGVWFLIGFIVLIGPAAIQTVEKGPYFGIAGYWCWIADPYYTQRVVLEYLWMIGSAILSFILYGLTFLRLRGNIHEQDGRFKFRMVDPQRAWRYQAGRDATDVQMTNVAKAMMGFPILFTITILPITICRFVAWSGKNVPAEATIFADSVFSLTGVFDMILFLTTRSLLPSRGMIPSWFLPRPKVSAEVMEHGVQPYYIQDFASAHGFNEMYQSQAERTMVTLPPRTNASLAQSSLSTPSRPSRPLSLLDTSYMMPPQTSLQDPQSLSRMGTKKTMSSQYSQDDSYIEYPKPSSPTAWDEVDLGRRISPSRSNFAAEPLNRPRSRDSKYTTFSLSAYTHGDRMEGPPPPLPSVAAIDSHVERSQWDDDDDEEELVSARRTRNTFTPLSFEFLNPDIRSPKPVARRF